MNSNFRSLVSLMALCFYASSTFATENPALRGTFRSASPAFRFDVSPPLRDMRVLPPADLNNNLYFAPLMADPWSMLKPQFGPQDSDGVVQSSQASRAIPIPSQSFNIGTGTANPPDPVGDVGPNHYLRMANASFQIFSKTGASLFGPAAINTLWQGFGGACETENAGDPIVLYDQLADRWLVTQFSDSAGPGFFNCVALSTTSDPTGSYFRYAFAAATFPDYPKYGIWPNAYLISTREVNASSIGAYAIDRLQMLAGNPSPTIISFVMPTTAANDEFLGDGLLPADLDGSRLPPAGSPAYYLGSMDDGGPYGAAQDALLLWKFDINFVTPALSSFVLANQIPIAPYDTIYPCNGRSCIPQPAPLGAVDILSYRQRPMHRAAYRNYGSYESIVTNQSVEAAPAMAGIRWWELRSPNSDPILVQDSTYAPGVTDGVQRWMGSIAADSSGNMALGYSAGSSKLFPSIRYTGRLESDPFGSMNQGEGEFVAGGGGHTATTRRWGDYTSMNVDSVDDCTFWYINEYFAVSGTQWTLRAGAFKFPDCGTPSFGIAATPLNQSICTPANATINVAAHGYNNFAGSTTLSATGQPPGASVNFSAPVINSVPGNSTLTIGNTAGIAAGNYTINVGGVGGAPSAERNRAVGLSVFTVLPTAPTLVSPAANAVGVSPSPTLSWNAVTQGVNYVVEVANDAAFTNIVFSSPASPETTIRVNVVLTAGTTYFWRARAANTCGSGLNSVTRSFTVRLAPGLCAAEQQLTTTYADTMDNGINGWTTDPVSGTTWTQSTARPFNGSTAWLAVDVVTASDQKLISPPISLPALNTGLLLRFQHDLSMEHNGGTPAAPSSCFDGGFVEISTDNGLTWNAIPAADVLEDRYDGLLSTGQSSWCGVQPYTQAGIDLDPYAGQTVRFRFRAITDTSVGNVPHGWYVDDLQVIGCRSLDVLFQNGFEGN